MVTALAASEDGTALIRLPDLTPWPGPLEKAHVLLQTAAEVEHALLVQYLYAACSLNRNLPDAAQKDAVTSWSDSLTHIAEQEMGHLMTVQNLLLALGFPPSLEREDFPPQKDLYPFTLHLQPLTQATLAKYIVAESPTDWHDIRGIVCLAEVDDGRPVHHVGMIYGLLAFLFSSSDAAQDQSDPVWHELMKRIDAAIGQLDIDDQLGWHLPDSAIDKQSGARQGIPQDWRGRGITVHHVDLEDGLTSAYEAIRQVAEEGEGFGDTRESHFSLFLGMFTGTAETLPFPSAEQWVPTLAVPTDPRTAGITDEQTRHWAELADLRYAMLLAAIEDYLRTTDQTRRDQLKRWARSDMTDLNELGSHLTTLPLDDGVAGPPFTMPPLPMPDTDAARDEIHRERRNAAIAKIGALPADDTLQRMLSDLTGRDDSAGTAG